MKQYMSVQIGQIDIKVIKGLNDWFWNEVTNKRWEPHTFTIIDKYLSRQTAFFDLGAWIGPITLYAAHWAKRVFAFEPDPVAFSELSSNIELNPHLNNIVICNYFVGSQPGKIKMGNTSIPGNSRSSIFYSNQKENWTVTSVNLVHYIKSNNIKPPYFLKIDIEGAEFEVMESLKTVFKYENTILYLSLHPQLLVSAIPGRSLVAKIRRRIFLLSTYLRLILTMRYLHYKCDINGKIIRLGNMKMLINGLLLKDYSMIAMNRRHQ